MSVCACNSIYCQDDVWAFDRKQPVISDDYSSVDMLHQREHGREGETGINGEYLSGAAVLESHRGKMGISHYMWLSQCFRILLFVIYMCVCVSFWCHEKTTSFQICRRNQKTTLLLLTPTCGNNVSWRTKHILGGPQWAHILCRPKTEIANLVPHVLISSYCRNGGFQLVYPLKTLSPLPCHVMKMFF